MQININILHTYKIPNKLIELYNFHIYMCLICTHIYINYYYCDGQRIAAATSMRTILLRCGEAGAVVDYNQFGDKFSQR